MYKSLYPFIERQLSIYLCKMTWPLRWRNRFEDDHRHNFRIRADGVNINRKIKWLPTFLILRVTSWRWLDRVLLGAWRALRSVPTAVSSPSMALKPRPAGCGSQSGPAPAVAGLYSWGSEVSWISSSLTREWASRGMRWWIPIGLDTTGVFAW